MWLFKRSRTVTKRIFAELDIRNTDIIRADVGNIFHKNMSSLSNDGSYGMGYLAAVITAIYRVYR